MIIGLGSDLIDIRRIEATLERFGDKFINRLFTQEEKAKAARRVNPAATYAKRFAAKEACAKALGTGFQSGVFFRDIGIVNLPSGEPTLRLTGGALARLKAITPPGKTAHLALTITDEPPLAQALVIITATPQS
jgi:holo-[acyl-carrier protein] synthase